MLIVDYMIVNHAHPLKSVRMISTLVGRFVQLNELVRVLYKHPNKDPEFNIHLALWVSSETTIWRASRCEYDQLQQADLGKALERTIWPSY